MVENLNLKENCLTLIDIQRKEVLKKYISDKDIMELFFGFLYPNKLK